MSTLLRVLIVEDEVLIADFVADLVEEAGYQVAGVVATGEAALTRLSSGGISLVLLDIKLKGRLTGIDVARAAQDLGVPHAFITGSGDPRMRAEAEATGPRAFLQKPVNAQHLFNLLEAIGAADR